MELWREMSPFQRHVEERVGRACFCEFISYSEHLPRTVPLPAFAPVPVASRPALLPGTIYTAPVPIAEEAAARAAAPAQCTPTEASERLYESAQDLRRILKVVAPYTEVVTVARSDDYFLPPELTPEVEWLTLSALHEAGLGIARVAVSRNASAGAGSNSTANNSTAGGISNAVASDEAYAAASADAKAAAAGAKAPGVGGTGSVLKQFIQMEQLLELTIPPTGMCTRAAPFCVDWKRPRAERCWVTEYSNDVTFP